MICGLFLLGFCEETRKVRALHAAKRLKKAGILARNSQSSVAFDWKSHTRKNNFCDSDWTYNFFPRV